MTEQTFTDTMAGQLSRRHVGRVVRLGSAAGVRAQGKIIDIEMRARKFLKGKADLLVITLEDGVTIECGYDTIVAIQVA